MAPDMSSVTNSPHNKLAISDFFFFSLRDFFIDNMKQLIEQETSTEDIGITQHELNNNKNLSLRLLIKSFKVLLMEIVSV